MGFNKRKMKADRRAKANAEAAARRATDAQVLEDAERLIAVWNERQARRMPMLFSPTIDAALASRHWYLLVRCPACCTTQSLIPALSCRSAVRRVRASQKFVSC